MGILGNIFDIQRFSVHDGPGIRTTVFQKGCPLKCIWCHNPESQKVTPSLAYYPKSCIGCGECVKVCPNACHKIDGEIHIFDRSACTECGKCAEACITDALTLFGRRASVCEIMDEVRRDKSFYDNSGGGLTVSGGEPLLQGEFLIELLRSAKNEGIATAIETSGFGKKEILLGAAEHTDVFLFDIKETDDTRHCELTGVKFTPILENLKLLDSVGANIVLRCPLIPGVNTRDEHLSAIADLAVSLSSVKEVNVMAYHTLGNGKYDALDMENKMEGKSPMTGDEKESMIAKIRDKIAELGGVGIEVK